MDIQKQEEIEELRLKEKKHLQNKLDGVKVIALNMKNAIDYCKYTIIPRIYIIG